jgi:DNA polymerase III epsilon subunit-like protein
MSTDITFVDTETLGLHPDAPIWEFAAIRRSDNKETAEHFFIQHDNTGWLDDYAEPFLRDYVNRFEPRNALPPFTAAQRIHAITEGAHIVGAVPNFDTERLAKLLRENTFKPSWHYHLIDVENIVVGFLAGRGKLMKPPWDSEQLSRAVGVPPALFDRHTAMGDVLWVQAQWDAVMTTRKAEAVSDLSKNEWGCICTPEKSCAYHGDHNPTRAMSFADNMPERELILQNARMLISGDRKQTYGDAATDFTRTGKMWAAVLGIPEVTAEQVAMCMALVKVGRLCETPTHRDSWIDGCGYLALGGEIAKGRSNA